MRNSIKRLSNAIKTIIKNNHMFDYDFWENIMNQLVYKETITEEEKNYILNDINNIGYLYAIDRLVKDGVIDEEEKNYLKEKYNIE